MSAPTVFHPAAIEGVIAFLQADDFGQSNEYLLLLRDSRGVTVSLRLQNTAIDSLVETLGNRPTKGPA